MARGVRAATAAGPVEGPWALPDGWRWERLGDVTSEPSRGSPSSKFKDTFRYLDVGGLGEGRVGDLVAVKDAPSRARQFLEAGDIALSTVRPYLRRTVHLQSQDADVASTAFCVLRAKPDLCSRFLLHWVTSDQFVSRLLPLQRGSSPPAVLDVDVRAQPVPVPPADLQRLLVSRIDTLFAEVSAGEEALAAAKASLGQWRQALLKAAVTGNLTADWRAANPPAETGEALLARILADRRTRWTQDPRNKGKRYPEPPPPDTTTLPTLPEGWVWASVAQLGEVITGATPPASNTDAFGGNIPFYTPSDLDAGKDVMGGKRSITPTGLAAVRGIPAGSVMVTCIGATIGKVAIARRSGATNQQINSIVPEVSELCDYVYFYFAGPGCGRLVDASSATTLPIINKGDFSRLAVPLPSLEEISEINRLLNEAHNGANELAEVEAELDRQRQHLRQSILAAAFRGELAA